MSDRDAPPIPPAPQRRTPKSKWWTDRALWFVIDIITGPNLRWRDNLYQGIIVFLGVCAGAWIGFRSNSNDPIFGAMIGGFLGILAALIGSGIVIMIYRALMHWRQWRG